ncbi:ribonuclease HII [Backusella circina FSU 941]|nr:ribonuclease HII [Backusella circina FSU 941]
MVYAVSYCPLSRYEEFKKLGFDAEKRVKLASIIEANLDWVGWAVYVISPQDISTNMLKRPVYNLNEMAHDATIKLIKHVVDNDINITEIYVDPVGPSAKYQVKLSSFFPNSLITVEPKADALYPIVSAASICAKVTRDQFVNNWVWVEEELEESSISKVFGSGYPSDPNTVRWLDENEDSFFGFPSVMRFSWSTVSTRMIKTRNVEWSEDEDDNPKPSTKREEKLIEEKRMKRERQRQRALKESEYLF